MNPQSAQQPDVLTLLREDLAKLISTRVDSEADKERQRQLDRLNKADAYYRGNPYLAQEFNVDTGAMSLTSISSSNVKDTDLYDYNIDITKSYGRKYYSVLGTRPFHNVKAKPADPKREEDRTAARQWDLGAMYLKTKWDARVMNIMVFYHQWKAGVVYGFVDHVANKKLWGETVEPIMVPVEQELEPAGYRCTSCGEKSAEPQVLPVQDPVTGASVEQTVCPQCGAALSDIHFEEAQTATVPVQQGERKYANAGPCLELLTGYQVTVPLDTKSLDKAPWLLYEYEEHPGALLALYRDQLKDHVDEKTGEIKSTANEGQAHELGRRSRESAAAIGGGQSEKKTRWTYSRYWLAPFMYEYVQDEDKRKILQENYPDGLKITRVEGIAVKLEEEAITDSWSVFEPEPGDYLYKDPMCWGVLGHQDVTNDAWNLMIQILEDCRPSAAFDPDIIDARSIQQAGATDMIPAKPGTGGRLEHAIAKLPTASFPEHAFGMVTGLESNVQSYTGLRPEVYGAGEKATTAEEARTRLNQALMQLGVPGEFAGRGWKDTLTNAINKIKKFGLKSVAVPTGSDDAELFDVEALRNGSAHFENDPGVPMSHAEIKDQINLIIGQNPTLAHAMGLDDPSNVQVIRDLLLPTMDDLQVPGEDRRLKVMETIRELLEQQPIMGDPMDPASQPQPSIMPEPFVDDPMDAGLVLTWIRSEAGRKIKRENPAGYANVVEYGKALSTIPVPPMGTPPPPPGPMDGKAPKQLGPPSGGPQPQSAAMPQ